MNKSVLSFIILLYINQIMVAQDRLKGKITDELNNPLTGANVYLPELNKGTVSDNNGNYIFNNLPRGKIKIQFSFIGFQNEIRTVLLSDTTVELNVNLKETPIEADEIVISGGYHSTQHENAVKIDVLKIRQSTNLSTPNFTEALTKVPGVNMISKGSGVSKPVIRGLSMDNILILNNGVRNENYQYSDHHPMGISEFGIEDAEVIKGPASLLYGSDAIGGVVNFINEKPAPAGQITGDFNSRFFSNTLGSEYNLGLKGASVNFFGGFRAGLKSHADFLQGGGSFAPNTRFNEASLKTNFGYTGKFGIFRILYEYNQQKLGLAEEEAIVQTSSRGRKAEIFYQQFNNHLISSQNKLFLNKYRLLIDAAFQSVELIHFADAGETEIDMALSTLTYETKLYLPSNEKSEYIIGFQGLNQLNININNAEVILLPDAVLNNYGLFGLIQYSIFNKIKLQTGIRYDYKTIISEETGLSSDFNYRKAVNKKYGSLSGSLGATYNYSEKLLFRANFAVAYRTPNIAELTSNGLHELRYELGDHSLVPQRSFESDVSLHYHFTNLTFEIAGFVNKIEDYIYISPINDTTPSGDIIYKYLQNNAGLFGGEAGIHFHPKHIDWLHLESAFSTVTGKQNNGNYLPFIPANKLTFEIKIEKEDLTFFKRAYMVINSQITFKQKNPAPDEEMTEGYTLFNAGLGVSVKVKNQEISLETAVSNIFDIKYADHLSTLKEVNLLNPGRNITVSLKVPFTIIK